MLQTCGRKATGVFNQGYRYRKGCPDSMDHPKNRMLGLRTEGLEPSKYWQAKKVEKNSHSSGLAKDNPTKPGCSRKILGTHSVPARGLCLHHSTSFYLASQVRLLRTNAPPVPAHRLRLRALPYLMSRCSCLYVVYGRYGAVIPARGLCLHHLQGGWRCGGRGRARRWWDTPAFCWAGSMPGGFGWRNRWSWPPPRL